MASFTDPPNGGKGQIRPPLRLVHPAPPQPPPRRRPGARPPSPFTDAENARLRAALLSARRAFSTWACLAAALYTTEGSVRHAAHGHKRVTPDMAVRLAKALGKPLESLYAAPSDAARCPTCGAPRGAP